MKKIQNTVKSVAAIENGMKRDPLKVAENIINFLDEHPHVGAIGGGAITTFGIGTLIHYVRKL